MKAGPELDKLIAEIVMGVPSATEPGISQQEYEQRRNAWHPEYSTDIAAAWEVFEKLKIIEATSPISGRLRTYPFTIYCDDDGQWNASFYGSYYDILIEVKASTAPHAICLAALRAVESSVPPQPHP